MSDVALAHNLIIEIAHDCWNGKGDMLDRVYDACIRHGKKFTRRRLRGFFHMESAHVRYHEMIDLADVAEKEKEARERLANARKEHADFIAKTARISSLLERTDEAFHSDEIARTRGIISRMGRAGVAR